MPPALAWLGFDFVGPLEDGLVRFVAVGGLGFGDLCFRPTSFVLVCELPIVFFTSHAVSQFSRLKEIQFSMMITAAPGRFLLEIHLVKTRDSLSLAPWWMIVSSLVARRGRVCIVVVWSRNPETIWVD
jgi:hypothetical protein